LARQKDKRPDLGGAHADGEVALDARERVTTVARFHAFVKFKPSRFENRRR